MEVMLAFIQKLIKEAVAEVSPWANVNYGKSIDRMHFPREKLLSLILKIYKRYGYSRANDEGVKPTYDRVLMALKNDPKMEQVEVDQAFVGDFMDSIRQKKIAAHDSLLLNKAISVLHSPQIKTGNIHPIIAAVAMYHRQNSMLKSGEVDTNKPMLFYKLRLKHATHDGSRRNDAPKRGSCLFIDQKENWFKKVGAPPSIHMRVSIGKGRILTQSPYEMREGDVFTFRGKVSHTDKNVQGYVVNVIDGIQPV